MGEEELDMEKRETLSSRLGFLLLSAGCAIGLGNVWRFPFITGRNGGGAFVLVYLVFLLILGLPIMVMEFSVGRAAQKNLEPAIEELEPKNTKWHLFGHVGVIGCYLLMMFYSVVSGWIFSYTFKFGKGVFQGMGSAEISNYFSGILQNIPGQLGWMIFAVALGFFICSRGLRNGVEGVTKIMMLCLFVLMLILSIQSFTMPGAKEGLKFYLVPDFNRMAKVGVSKVVFDAMGQAFFTLSIGMGSMTIFGSYINKEHSLTGESLRIIGLDTMVAIMAGLIIFPACFTYDLNLNAGPGLLFVTLPTIFSEMPGGRFWGSLFFVFMSFAALSTLIAVFENIISYWMDTKGWSRKKASLINAIILVILSIPCILGFNIWSGFKPFGLGSNVLDLEDFLVSSTILPLGSVVYVFFCTSRYGWGWNGFIKEADSGIGTKFPKKLKFYFKYVLPILILAVFINGYLDKF